MMEEKLDIIMKLVVELQGMQVPELRRGPFLAVVEIEKRRLLLRKKAVASEQPQEQSSSLVTAIVAYFDRFGHLLSFSSDISSFVQYIDEGNKLQLSVALHEASARTISENPVKQLKRKVSAFQVEEQLKVKLALSDKDLLSHASEIVKLYLESLELSVDLDAQESMHGEELLVLATNLLTEVFRRTQQFGYLLEAILVLEFGLYARRFSSQYKLMLIHLYSMLSAVTPALDWYRTLDVKYILLETLSHVILPSISGSTRWSDLQSLFKDSLKFYESHRADSADLTILAYQHCTYSKVLEFVEFKERLERSHQRLIFRIEAEILSLKQKADKLEEVELGLGDLDFGKKAVEWSSEENLKILSFNEDLQTRPWWSPEPDKCYLIGPLRTVSCERSWHHIETEEEQRNRESRWRSAVRRRCLVPRILCLLLSTVRETGASQQSGNSTSLLEFRELLEEFLKSLSLNFSIIENWFLQAIFPGKLMEDSGISVVEMMSLTVFWTSYQLTCDFTKSNLNAALVAVNVMEYIIEELLRALTCDLCGEGSDGKERKTVKVITPGTAVSSLVGLISESFAWLALYLQAWARHSQPVTKKKKKGAGSGDPNDNPICSDLLASLESIQKASIVQLEKLKACLTDHLKRPEDLEVGTLLALLQQYSGGPSCPGSILSVLESGLPIATKLAVRSPNNKQTWGRTSYVKNLVSSQRTTLVGIQDLCTLRLKAFRSLKF